LEPASQAERWESAIQRTVMSSHNLAKLPSFDQKSGCWNAIVETPKDSHHKFDFVPKSRCFELKRTLPEGMTFPLDFGFIPSTLGEDGDPIDVLVVLDFPAVVGTLVKVRLVGGIKAEQKEKGEDWIRNDRLVAVSGQSCTLADVKSLDDLRPQQLDQLVEFFKQYNKLDGKHFRHIGYCSAQAAGKLLRKAINKTK
jgi:inorganic pyrophosphatase